MNRVRGQSGGIWLWSTAILLIASLGVAVAVALDARAFLQRPLAVPEAGAHLVVKPGAGLRHVADTLSERGYTNRPWYLLALGRWREQSHRIQAGEYRIAAGTTPGQLLDQLVRGRVMQHTLTIVEGWTFRQMLAAVAAHDALEHRLTGLDDEEIMARIGHPGQPPEGRFLPETYHFPRGTSDVDFLRRAHADLARYLQKAWEERAPDLPYETPEEALILASVIERETGVPAERAQVAGVFVRRLQKGMRLQSDPTVIYGMGDAYDGNIRVRDLRRDTPYNTYTRGGLPPTPIALPSRASIHAALNPADGDAVYFVSRGDGSHVFSKTLEEHNRAVRRYQLGGGGS